jgi:hypothetical protein
MLGQLYDRIRRNAVSGPYVSQAAGLVQSAALGAHGKRRLFARYYQDIERLEGANAKSHGRRLFPRRRGCGKLQENLLFAYVDLRSS